MAPSSPTYNGIGTFSASIDTLTASFTAPGTYTAPGTTGDAFWDAKYAAALPAMPTDPNATPATTNAAYVSTTGNDSTGNGSRNSPFATISGAVGSITGGGQIIVLDGTYTDSGLAMAIANIPAGADTNNRTVVRAENRFGVRINFPTAFNFGQAAVDITGFVWVDGFLFACAGASGLGSGDYVALLGANARMTRCGCRNEYASAYGGIWAPSADTLVEDCFGFGSIRYGYAGGPGSLEIATENRTVARRVVIRTDYNDTAEPKADFSWYGNNSSNIAADASFQACISIDSERGYSGGSQDSYGSFYCPKNTQRIEFLSCMSIKKNAGNADMFLLEQTSQDHTVQDYVSVAPTLPSGFPPVLRPNGVEVTTGGYVKYNRVSIYEPPNTFIEDGWTGTTKTIGNSLFWSSNASTTFGTHGFTVSTCAFEPSSMAQGTGSVTNFTKPLYPVRTTDSPELNGTIGAQVLYSPGKFLSHWGETDYNTPQDGTNGQANEPLWPWPYEGYIKAFMSESWTTPGTANETPSTLNTTRGFCAPGNALDGNPLTLTRYIWELLGNAMPAGIY